MHSHTDIPQFIDHGETIHDISGKPGYRLSQDKLDLPSLGILNHLEHALPMRQLSTRDALVAINTGKLPVRITLDPVSKIIDLKLVGRFLFIVLR